jgi:hypothetical protein
MVYPKLDVVIIEIPIYDAILTACAAPTTLYYQTLDLVWDSDLIMLLACSTMQFPSVFR